MGCVFYCAIAVVLSAVMAFLVYTMIKDLKDNYDD